MPRFLRVHRQGRMILLYQIVWGLILLCAEFVDDILKVTFIMRDGDFFANSFSQFV